MPRRLALAVLLVVMLGSVSCGSPGSVGPVAGSGTVRTEDRPVQGFTRVELEGLGDLTVTQSSRESLKVEADDNVLPVVTSEVRGNTLVLALKPGNFVRPTKLNFTVTVKQLDGVKINGSGNARIVDVASPALEVGISGSGYAQSAGRADALKLEISGSGKYDGAATAARTATVEISGSGEAVVQVSQTLDVKISGAGSVEYIGNPSVTKNVSGSGEVSKRG